MITKDSLEASVVHWRLGSLGALVAQDPLTEHLSIIAQHLIGEHSITQLHMEDSSLEVNYLACL